MSEHQHPSLTEPEVVMLHQVRFCLRRWAARYAKSDHTKAHVKETQLLIDQLGELLLKE